MKEIIVYQNPKSPISESYRSLRTSVQFANVDRNTKTILVTSATPGEGKTTTLCNLAVAMVQNGHKVMVVDCDMRKPRVHKLFELSNRKGLADMLLRGEAPDGYVQHIPELDLDVITAGHVPANPSELLHAKAMKELVASLRETYDYVFFDAPPVVPVTDATIMSTYIDGVILVVASGSVETEIAKRAQEALSTVGANVLGVVLNKIPMDDPRAYSSYYYYYGSKPEDEVDAEADVQADV
jgi:capsular exopolysaccharide synthesis family protein